MTTTVQQIIDRAAARSNLNDAALIDTAELIAYINQFERRIYMTANRENPDFFGAEGATAARASGGTWTPATTPGNVGAISRIEVSAITGAISGLAVGDEISVVSIRNPDVAVGPRVYIRGGIIREWDESLTSGGSFVSTLKLYYSVMPTAKTATGNSMTLPDEYCCLVDLPLARVMALRDQRPDELPGIDQELLLEWTTFLQQVGVYDEVTIRELAQIPASYNPVTPGE